MNNTEDFEEEFSYNIFDFVPRTQQEQNDIVDFTIEGLRDDSKNLWGRVREIKFEIDHLLELMGYHADEVEALFLRNGRKFDE